MKIPEAVATAVTHAYADSNPGVIELSASASPYEVAIQVPSVPVAPISP